MAINFDTFKARAKAQALKLQEVGERDALAFLPPQPPQSFGSMARYHYFSGYENIRPDVPNPYRRAGRPRTPHWFEGEA